MTAREFPCHRISPGQANGPALVSTDDICFYLVDPLTGIIIEEGHAAQGQSVAGRVVICPSGKGSSVVQADGLYQLRLHGNQPLALIIRHPETVLVASAIIMETPLVDRAPEDFYAQVATGDLVEVDADHGTIRLEKHSVTIEGSGFPSPQPSPPKDEGGN